MRTGNAASRLLLRATCYAILLFWLLVVLAPLYWVLIASLKTPITVRGGATYRPWVDFRPVLDNWRRVLLDEQDQLLPPLLNSLVVSLGGTTVAVLLGAMAGYGLARFQYRFLWMRTDAIATWFLSQRM